MSQLTFTPCSTSFATSSIFCGLVYSDIIISKNSKNKNYFRIVNRFIGPACLGIFNIHQSPLIKTKHDKSNALYNGGKWLNN